MIPSTTVNLPRWGEGGFTFKSFIYGVFWKFVRLASTDELRIAIKTRLPSLSAIMN